jgi:hypothetical protein
MHSRFERLGATWRRVGGLPGRTAVRGQHCSSRGPRHNHLGTVARLGARTTRQVRQSSRVAHGRFRYFCGRATAGEITPTPWHSPLWLELVLLLVRAAKLTSHACATERVTYRDSAPFANAPDPSWRSRADGKSPQSGSRVGSSRQGLQSLVPRPYMCVCATYL